VRGVAARGRRAWSREEWFIAVRERSAGGGIAGPPRAVPNPPGRYLCDPFVFEAGGRHFVFCEDLDLATGRGAVSAFELGPDGAPTPPRPVLERDHHLSYPFVFAHDGAAHMIPETGEAGRIELHTAVELPARWRLERVLIDGLTAHDATLHTGDDGTLWLFASIVDGPADPGVLHLFSAPALDAVWTPHPANPIVADPGRARPAGRLFRRGGELIRPSQDGSRRYGEAVVLNRVDVLTPTAYRETPVGRIDPDWMPGLVGTHTYTFDSRFECLDGGRRVRRF
jgi:hypothetical protein